MTASTEPTMSSREIAEVVESRHADVCRTVERLMAKGVIQGYAPMAYTHHQNGQQYTEYHINKRDSYVVVAQLSPEFTARLVDRWQELEAQVAQPFQLPQTMAEALRLAADVLAILDLDRKALERLDDGKKGVSSIHSPGGRQSMVVVNEPGLRSVPRCSARSARFFCEVMIGLVGVVIIKPACRPNCPSVRTL
ncbi:Rha family transcriptional regulator [Halomonas sp. H5]|uniref:Rha family transcriptional regulator n=1 Tax=Halomonas sp. H5 TaxID=3423910 RepID=UPI003D3633E4